MNQEPTRAALVQTNRLLVAEVADLQRQLHAERVARAALRESVETSCGRRLQTLIGKWVPTRHRARRARRPPYPPRSALLTRASSVEAVVGDEEPTALDRPMFESVARLATASSSSRRLGVPTRRLSIWVVLLLSVFTAEVSAIVGFLWLQGGQ